MNTPDRLAAALGDRVLPLFDAGEADGFLYYVMPFIDGEPLRDKLNRETRLGIWRDTQMHGKWKASFL